MRELPVRLPLALGARRRRSARRARRRYLAAAERVGAPIVAVFETHVQADHVSGLPALVEATGATAYLPDGAGVEFAHTPLGRRRRGRAREHDRPRAGDAGARAGPSRLRRRRPAARRPRSPGSSSPATRCSSATSAGPTCTPAAIRSRSPAQLHASIGRLLELPDHVLVYPSHFGGSVCGRALSGEPLLVDRLRAPPQPGARARRRGQLRAGAARRRAAAAGRPGGDRRRQPARAARRPRRDHGRFASGCGRTRASSPCSSR